MSRIEGDRDGYTCNFNTQHCYLSTLSTFHSRQQRVSWAEHFSETDMNCLFFSAVDDEEDGSPGGEESDSCSSDVGRILSPFEILDAVGRLTSEPRFTVGFLGYPNVGKSSTINRFLTNKKLQVRANSILTKSTIVVLNLI